MRVSECDPRHAFAGQVIGKQRLRRCQQVETTRSGATKWLPQLRSRVVSFRSSYVQDCRGATTARHMCATVPGTKATRRDAAIRLAVTRPFETRLLQIFWHFVVIVADDARQPPSGCAQQYTVPRPTKAGHSRPTCCCALIRIFVFANFWHFAVIVADDVRQPPSGCAQQYTVPRPTKDGHCREPCCCASPRSWTRNCFLSISA